MTHTAVITGGTGGLGRETARELAAAGWRVVITGRDAGQVAAHAAELQQSASRAAMSRGPASRALASRAAVRRRR